jgi:hypothetical protein
MACAAVVIVFSRSVGWAHCHVGSATSSWAFADASHVDLRGIEHRLAAVGLRRSRRATAARVAPIAHRFEGVETHAFRRTEADRRGASATIRLVETNGTVAVARAASIEQVDETAPGSTVARKGISPAIAEVQVFAALMTRIAGAYGEVRFVALAVDVARLGVHPPAVTRFAARLTGAGVGRCVARVSLGVGVTASVGSGCGVFAPARDEDDDDSQEGALHVGQVSSRKSTN